MRARRRLVSILVLAAIIGAGCTNDADGASDGELVDLPDDHPAALILATAPTFSEFSEAATEQDLRFVCAESVIWQVCLVVEDDVLAVVPFEVPSGLNGTVESGSLDDAVSIPLDRGPTGVSGVDLTVTLTLSRDGEMVGSISGP